jgi:hypothetical protein
MGEAREGAPGAVLRGRADARSEHGGATARWTLARRQPAAAGLPPLSDPGDSEQRLLGLDMLEIEDGRVRGITGFASTCWGCSAGRRRAERSGPRRWPGGPADR